ncbi:TRAF3-interacting protein 1-like isoform X2 [Gigantopelta aegis]|uniref:TRAF3-interacting protein 1-like isoform X2 n=1 Tax=Gigantopelta aegis TaxID=1735272 RepID=UPI001B88952B|nr:TRAF3-interacting protein 1-like isoform X2 [Gigantopelta aegis]
MDPKMIKKTQDTLGKAIKKPPLTDKLLSKPPFRFLHDVFTSVIKTTGFMKGLFSEKELNSENIKDRDSKIAFLQKGIDFVSMVTGKSLAVRPQKIVAGSEPEKTNEFLQALAEAIKLKVNNEEYVKKFNKVASEEGEEKTDPEKDREKKKHKPEERRDKDKEKHRSRDKDSSRERSRDEGKGDDHDREKDREKDKEKDRDERSKEKKSKRPNHPDSRLVDKCQVEGDFTPKKDLTTGNTEHEAGEAPVIKKKMSCSSELGRQEIGSWGENPVSVQTDVDRKRKGGSKNRTSGHRDSKSKEGAEKPGAVVKSPEKAVHGSTSQISIAQPSSTSKPAELAGHGHASGAAKGRRSSAIKSLSVTSKSSSSSVAKTSRASSSSQIVRAESKHGTKSDSSSRRLKHRGDSGKENQHPGEPTKEHEKQESPARIPRPTSAKGSRRRREGRIGSDEEDEVFQQKPSRTSEPAVTEEDLPPQVVAARKLQRPPSARPAPPRPKQDGMESEPAMRLGTGKPANVIVDDGKQSDDDDDDNFIVEESVPPPIELDQQLSKQEDEDDTEHGALVKKMLETKKEFEEQPQGSVKKTEIERPSMSDAARRKQREVVKREIEKICASIQGLTRSANPLGKIMDYVQEDLDSMQKELERWRSENKEHALELKRESGITDRSIEPLRAQLSELEQAISDKLDLIAATKSKIIKNDSKIDKLLMSMSKS